MHGLVQRSAWMLFAAFDLIRSIEALRSSLLVCAHVYAHMHEKIVTPDTKATHPTVVFPPENKTLLYIFLPTKNPLGFIFRGCIFL